MSKECANKAQYKLGYVACGGDGCLDGAGVVLVALAFPAAKRDEDLCTGFCFCDIN